uniref:RBR-type E3 ubiquitin transferase n=1 Tax=Saccoglossus kowalevskii TaxID=10224 RepID=A0ABM0MDS1_SACKO
MAVGGVLPSESDELVKLKAVCEENLQEQEDELLIPVQLSGDHIEIEAWMPIETDMSSTQALSSKSESGRPNICRSDSGKRWHSTFSVAQLTPLQINVTFPLSYPSDDPPFFTLCSEWLDGGQLSALCRHLDAMWGEMSQLPIVYSWVDWLKNESLSFLGLEKTVVLSPYQNTDDDIVGPVDPRALPTCVDLQKSIIQILRHNITCEMEKFQREDHQCGICFDTRTGSEFYRLGNCTHHFCHECLAAYCTTHVSEGTVQLLVCPDSDCKNPLPPALVRDVLTKEQYERWEKLSLQKTLDAMDDIDYCPRCNMAVIKESDHSNLAHCTSCFYSYCTSCKESWHQGTKCVTLEGKLKEMAEADADSQRADAKLVAQKLKQYLKEEHASKQAIKCTTVACPGCLVRIERNQGCNHMTCVKCKTEFCWLCQKAIVGYGHFSSCAARGLDDPRQDYVAPIRRTPVRPQVESQAKIHVILSLHPERKKDLVKCPCCQQQNLRE